MNQTDAMMAHADMLRGLFSQFIGIEYSRALDELRQEAKETGFDIPPDDDDDPRNIDPGSLKFEVDIARAFTVAQDATNTFMVSTGFAEEIPPDDRRRGGPTLRATVPKQFQGDIPPLSSAGGARSMTNIEAVALRENLAQYILDVTGHDGSDRHFLGNVRSGMTKLLQEAGLPCPDYFMPPEHTGRKPFPWETDDEEDDDE